MWDITNNTPFQAQRGWVRQKNGAEVWLVAVKGTFGVGDGQKAILAQEQMEVCMAPQFWGDPESSSLLYDTDLVRTKDATDVLLHGSAYAQKGHHATRVDVGLKIANINKKLTVFGNRYWNSSLLGTRMTQPEPFAKIPVRYESAFGGTDEQADTPKEVGWEARNPVGLGYVTQSEHLPGRPAPNVEYADNLISSWKDRPAPAGYGPIAGHWTPRVELAGTYDEQWEKERFPLLPLDFDRRYYQCAPPDQQVHGFLKGGETVELFNLTPSGMLRFELPRVQLAFRTHFTRAGVAEHNAVLHSVIFEPDMPRVIMVWHTHLECHHRVTNLMDTTIDLIAMDAASG